MDAPPSLAPFLPSPEQVDHTLQTSTAFRDFYTLAVRNSGLDMRHVDPGLARYRIADPVNGVRDNLSWENTVTAGERVLSLRELLMPQRALERDRLIYALWSLAGFAQVKAFVRALQVVVRYGHDAQGQLLGNVLLAQSLVPMIETVERRDYVLPNGDMASDAITRNLGLRAKVFSLDRARRKETGDENSIFDRLSRTLSRVNN